MEILNIEPSQYKLFLLILIRISVVLFLFPIFGSTVFPNIAKTGFALVLTMLLFSIIKIDPAFFPETNIELIVIIGAELLFGLSLGMTLRIFFAGIQYAGQLIGFQMGFMMANVIDPMSGAQLSIIEQLAYWVALTTFFFLNGHHILISTLIDSYQVMNIGGFSFSKGLLVLLLSLGADIFILAIKIGAPAIAALLFTSVAFGICAKLMPKMNILIVGFPVKIIIGFIFFGLSLQIIAFFTHVYLSEYKQLLSTCLKLAGGS